MYSVTKIKSYTAPSVCEKEILRYSGCKTADKDTIALLHSCLQELDSQLVYRVCYRELSCNICGSICDFGLFKLQSSKLASNLADCKKAVLFAATLGVEIDRLIFKYSRLSPSKALMMQAIGAERIEALCDCFCNEIKKETGLKLKPRFSPGYGDLALDSQKEIFSILSCSKNLGMALNDSLLISPSKSVTAFVGLCGQE